MKKIKQCVIVALLLITVMSSHLVTFAANPWPSLSSSKYCEYTANKTIPVYKNKDCTKRGTVTPSKSYNAYIEKGDLCYIYTITSKYAEINYPTPNGRRTGYAKTTDVFSTKYPYLSYAGHDGKINTYTYPGGKKIGYTEASDDVFVLTSDGDYYSIIYTAKSGKRAFKYGWIKFTGLWWESPILSNW